MFGVCLIAFITGLGGGTVRDLLLGNYPVTWTQHLAYLYLIICAGLLGMLEDFNLLYFVMAGLSLRLAAIHWSLSLSVFSYDPQRWAR